MRNNQPVTQTEQKFVNNDDLVSITDLQGKIKYVNDAFVAISGYTREELIGQDHNLVRHPDMPPKAFADLWGTLKSGKAWRGMVKNRCKNGDYYWVDAFVIPIVRNGSTTSYQSVRALPSDSQIAQAEHLYKAMKQDPSKELPSPSLVKKIQLRTLNRLFGCFSIVFAAIIGIFAISPFIKSIGLLSGFASIFIMVLNEKRLFAKLEQIIDHNRQLAAGDFTKVIEVEGLDELASVQTSTKMVQGRYKTVFMQISESLNNLLSTADSLSASSHDVLHSMQEQNSHTTQVATGMNEMSVTVDGVTSNVQNTAQTTTDLTDIVEQSDQVVADTLHQMQAFTEDMSQTSSAINELSKESEKITSITNTISDIADQTNLLALNAAIEAARAGEQGRGFAVVADEVRSLAGRTQEATQEIRSMLDKITSDIQQSAGTIEQNSHSAISALEKVSLTRDKFAEITLGVDNINSMSSEIATAASEQSTVANEMATSIEHISSQASRTELQGERLQRHAMQVNTRTIELQAQISELELSKAASLDFTIAKQGHLAWKTRVRSFLNGDKTALTRDQACSHRDCVLGKWYYKDGIKQYGNNGAFKAIEQPHEELHSTIVKILDENEQGNSEKAEELYTRIDPLSKKIVSYLDDLERAAKR